MLMKWSCLLGPLDLSKRIYALPEALPAFVVRDHPNSPGATGMECFVIIYWYVKYCPSFSLLGVRLGCYILSYNIYQYMPGPKTRIQEGVVAMVLPQTNLLLYL